MRKEVLIAIIIGFTLGLIITFGVWQANKALKETAPKKEAPPQITEEQLPTPTPQPLLVITSPEDNSISNKEKIDVSGKTFPQATVVIIYEEGEKIVEADGGGNFSAEINLVGGANEITISAFDKDGNEMSKTLNVVYSTAEI
ncbi:MAG: Ig-like domain-containing protein [Microgenomates group bacterium]